MRKTIVWFGAMLILLVSSTLYAADQSAGFKLEQTYNDLMAVWYEQLDEQLRNGEQDIMTIRDVKAEAGKNDLFSDMSEWKRTSIQMSDSEVAAYHHTYMTDLQEIGEDMNPVDKLRIYEKKKTSQIEQEIEEDVMSFLEEMLND